WPACSHRRTSSWRGSWSALPTWPRSIAIPTPTTRPTGRSESLRPYCPSPAGPGLLESAAPTADSFIVNLRRALPGLLVGLLGVAAAIVGLVTGRAWLYLPAAVCSLAAGLLSLLLAERLEEADARAEEVEERAERS